MFLLLGRWDAIVDAGWRLAIPSPLASHLILPLNNSLLLQEREDGSIWILRPPKNIGEVQDTTSTFLVEVKESKGARVQNQKRILIPSSLRKSTSFFFGRKVTLAGKGDHLEIWPRP